MKVAVIGSGLAGLTTAYLLRREGVEVWLIEKSNKLGFHSQSVEIPLSSLSNEHEKSTRRSKNEKDVEEKWVVDVPMRGFQGGYYPLLLSLYYHLKIPLEISHYKFSFSSSSSKSTYFIHSGSSGLSIPSLPSRAYHNIFNLVGDIYTFICVAICYTFLVALSLLGYHNLLPSSLSTFNPTPTQGRRDRTQEHQLTLREFTTIISAFLTHPFTIPFINYEVWTPLGEMFESFFISNVLVPIFSSVGTMTIKDCYSLPISIVLEYIHLTLGTDHYHLGKGFTASSIADLLAKPVREQGEGYVRLSTEIAGLEYQDGVKIRMTDLSRTEEGQAGAEQEILVDRVIIATPASVAKLLLEGLESSLKEAGQVKECRRVGGMRAALGKINYRESIVITHRDTSILPSPRDRRDLNFLLPNLDTSSPPTSSTETLPVPYFTPTQDTIYAQATQIILPPKRLRRKGWREMMVLQTTNPAVSIDPRRVLSVSKLERALPIKQPHRILPHLRSSTLDSCVYIVGSYAYPGIPLLEGCVGSAKKAVETILNDEFEQRTGFVRQPKKPLGGVDWDVGKGGWVQRGWRWRWFEGTWI